MDFKSFRLGVTTRAILLFLAIFALIYSSYKNEWYVTTLATGIFSLVILVEIIRYAEKYKRSLSEFLLSVKSRDFISSSVSIFDKNTKDTLKDAYQTIINEFQNIRIDKEIQFHYLKTVVEHIKNALLSFDEKGNIEFINKSAKDLLNQNNIKNLSSIKDKFFSLYQLFYKLKSGNNELIKININGNLMQLSVFATEFKIKNKVIKLISLQDIKQELEYQEVESWQKLIRVLTHEIMNSVTPISSLSNSVNETLAETKGVITGLNKISDEDFKDIISSLKTIENRSKGLLKFVSSYKQLTRLPKPDFQKVSFIELINHCHTLLKKNLQENNILFRFNYTDAAINTLADYDQIEQVIINILINAIDAVKTQKNPEILIEISNYKANNYQISVKDNGTGIHPEEIEKIFIPFYTTKKEGSGIGLSLSRQIMRLHKGTIQVNSIQENGSEFILKF